MLDTIDGLMDRQSNCIDDNERVSPDAVYPWLMCKETVVSVSLIIINNNNNELEARHR